MLVSISRFVRHVRTMLDLDPQSPPLLAGAEGLGVDQIIQSALVPAVERAHREAPLTSLGDAMLPLPRSVYWADDDGSGLRWGWVLLPSDFMRLGVFAMAGWWRPVLEPIDQAHPEYALQRSPLAGLRGCPQRPVCALANRAEGLALEFYACADADAEVQQGMYVPYPAIDPAGAISVAAQCYQQAIAHAANLAAKSLSGQ